MHAAQFCSRTSTYKTQKKKALTEAITVKDLARLPLRTASVYALRGTRWQLEPLRWMFSSQVFHYYCFTPCTNLPSVFQAKQRLTSHSASEVDNQPRTSGCLVISGRCWPSAADEEWYSPKRLYSTVAANRNELNAKVSAFFFCIFHSS